MAKVEQISKDVWKITEDFVSSYLIVGQNEALMIDTGLGTCGMGELVKTYTNLPCMAVLTHNHSDHLGAVDDFEMVHCHVAHLMELMKRFASMPYAIAEDFRFDLGGTVLTVLSMPGHSAGSIVLFDEKNRRMFTGDILSDTPVYMIAADASFPEYVKSLDRLMDMAEKVDGYYGCHETVPMDMSWAKKLKSLAVDIMEGNPYEVKPHTLPDGREVLWAKGHGVSFYLNKEREYRC